MNENLNNPPGGRGGRIPTSILAAIAALAPGILGQGPITARPYGEPSASGGHDSAVLGLYYSDSDSTLRLEGGAPGVMAMIVFAGEQGATRLPTGATVLIGEPIETAIGSFDAEGVFTLPLTGARFDRDGDTLFVQGAEHGASLEWSTGLRLTRAQELPPAVDASPIVPDEILVEEFAGMLRRGYLEAALDTALNSDGDTLKLDITGNLEVPVAPGITAGGKVAFQAAVKRGEDSTGAVVYHVLIGTDIAASAGVGVGVAGLGVSRGVGGDTIWRYASAHQVARALRSMAILLAVPDGLEHIAMALDSRLAEVDRAIATTRRALDRIRIAARSRLSRRLNPVMTRLQHKADSQRARRRALLDGGRRNLEAVIGWVASARGFLDDHLHGVELRSTVAFDVNVGTGFGDAKQGGQWNFANLGASGAAGLQVQHLLHVERDDDATTIEFKIVRTTGVAGTAGLGIGAAAEGKRVIELGQLVRIAADGTVASRDITARLTFDGRLLGCVGAVATGQGGVGGEVSMELSLADLLAIGPDAIDALCGADVDAAARVLCQLASGFSMRGRYEAGVAAGFGVDLDGVFKGGLGMSATMIDCGPTSTGTDIAGSLLQLLQNGVATRDAQSMRRFEQVQAEVAAVWAR